MRRATYPKDAAVITFGFLSTYPPTVCGTAAFTSSLRAALPVGARGGVVRLVESWTASGAEEVVGDLVAGSAESCREAAALLDRYDVAVVQHDYGIYGGADGDDVVRVLAALSVPAVVVVHTVLAAPTAHQRAVLDEVLAAAASRPGPGCWPGTTCPPDAWWSSHRARRIPGPRWCRRTGASSGRC
jgi:hypothetical protein